MQLSARLRICQYIETNKCTCGEKMQYDMTLRFTAEFGFLTAIKTI